MLLRITPIPADHLPVHEQRLAGINRFECPACPYQMILDKRYYERKTMKSKEVEDVLGGADSWKNVDKTQGELFCRRVSGFVVERRYKERRERRGHGRR